MPEHTYRRQVEGFLTGAVDGKEPLHDRGHRRQERHPVLSYQAEELVRLEMRHQD